LAHTPGFEGDTQFGGDVAFVPGSQRYYSSFGTDTGMSDRNLARMAERSQRNPCWAPAITF
jgi:hypothetical protein